MNQYNNLSVSIGDIVFQNPVMTASGTFGYGAEFSNYIELNKLGAIIVKGISLEPSPGNSPPRIIETPCGMLNAIGLENVGFNSFLSDKLPFLESLSTKIIVNIYGKTIQEYECLAEKFNELESIAAIEVNISCPNVKEGGIAFGTQPLIAAKVIDLVRKKTSKPVIAKLSPNVTDIADIARHVESAGADAVSLINTITGMSVDIHSRKPKLANIFGGLSGPAIKPIAVRMVYQVAQAIKIPIIGIGGIMNTQDALEFIIAGATAVQIGTANFIDPNTTILIIKGLNDFLAHHHINHISEIIGSIQV